MRERGEIIRLLQTYDPKHLETTKQKQQLAKEGKVD